MTKRVKWQAVLLLLVLMVFGNGCRTCDSALENGVSSSGMTRHFLHWQWEDTPGYDALQAERETPWGLCQYLTGVALLEGEELPPSREEAVVLLRNAWHSLPPDAPELSDCRRTLSLLLLDMGKTQEAWEVLEEKPGEKYDPVLEYGRMMLELATARMEKAYRRFQTLCRKAEPERLPLTAEGWMLLGTLGERFGTSAETLCCFENALLRQPQNPDCCNAVGYFLAVSNQQLDRAEMLVLQALKARPGTPAYLDSLAWIKYRQGKFSEAKQQILECVRHMEGRDVEGEVAEHLQAIFLALKEELPADVQELLRKGELERM